MQLSSYQVICTKSDFLFSVRVELDSIIKGSSRTQKLRELLGNGPVL